MAEKVTVKSSNDLDGAQLVNAASEATLLILATNLEKWAKGQKLDANDANKKLKDLANSANEAEEEIRELGDAIEDTTNILEDLGGGALKLVKFLGGMATGIISAGSAAVTMGASFVQTAPNITDFSGAIKDSALNVFGLGTAFDALVKMIYANYGAFQDLSKSGIALGDRISTMQADFAAMGVDLGTMVSSLRANSESLVLLGNASKGAELAIEASRTAFDQNATELGKFGMSFEEQTDRFTTFFGMNALAMRQGTITQQQVINQSQSYAKTIRRLSELTGMQSDAIEAEIEKANLNKAFETFVASLDPTEADRIRKTVAGMGAALGDGGRELAMARAMGLTTLTDAATDVMAYGTNISQMTDTLMAGARDQTLSADQYNTLMENQFRSAAQQQQMAQRENLATSAYLIAQGNGGLNDIVRFAQLFGGTAEDAASNFGNLDGTGNTILTFDKVIADLRSALADLSAKFFSNPDVNAGFDRVANWVKTFDIEKYNPFNPEGRSEILKSITNLWTSLLDSMNAAFVNSSIYRTLTGTTRRDVASSTITRDSTSYSAAELENLASVIRENASAFQSTGTGAGIDANTQRELIHSTLSEASRQLLEAGVESNKGFFRNTSDQYKGFMDDLVEKAQAGTITEQESQLLRELYRGMQGLGVMGDYDVSRVMGGSWVGNELPDWANDVTNQISNLDANSSSDDIMEIIRQTFESQRQAGDTDRDALIDSIATSVTRGFNTSFDSSTRDRLLSLFASEIAPQLSDLPQFNQGTKGFEDFGKGRLAMLHGQEAVIPLDSPLGQALNQMMNSEPQTNLVDQFNSWIDSQRTTTLSLPEIDLPTPSTDGIQTEFMTMVNTIISSLQNKTNDKLSNVTPPEIDLPTPSTDGIQTEFIRLFDNIARKFENTINDVSSYVNDITLPEIDLPTPSTDGIQIEFMTMVNTIISSLQNKTNDTLSNVTLPEITPITNDEVIDLSPIKILDLFELPSFEDFVNFDPVSIDKFILPSRIETSDRMSVDTTSFRNDLRSNTETQVLQEEFDPALAIQQIIVLLEESFRQLPDKRNHEATIEKLDQLNRVMENIASETDEGNRISQRIQRSISAAMTKNIQAGV